MVRERSNRRRKSEKRNKRLGGKKQRNYPKDREHNFGKRNGAFREGTYKPSPIATPAEIAKHTETAKAEFLQNRQSGPRSISEIAREIKGDWKKVYFGAVPYLDAMMSLNSINDMYYQDSAKSVVAYFLSNATSWRGDTARRVKTELKAMLKSAKGRW